ncbi:MAG: PQQ-dependent sugar dehydrogenase [Bacteroidetes bacterium]|nr:PQQ-dependent sugar dehydrogenase [Bacteroidota bacterium]MDA1121874.1 PQQ-dependent sugar dehydrogenase [Bacteroidota bacterium]
MLIVYEQDSPFADNLDELIDNATSLGLSVDTVSLKNDRIGDDLWINNSVALLADPNILSPQWQSDIERYTQSGGGILIPDVDVNQYQWPWMFKAKANEGPDYDGGKISFFKNASDLDEEIIKGSLVDDDINEHVRSLSAPDDSRFTRIVLDADINEPMELDILPDGKVIFIEREGNFKLYDPEIKKTKILHKFHVSTEGNYEDGMLGLALDPNYNDNHWVYFYYSPYGGHPRQELTRMMLISDSLHVNTEKLILEVGTQRETCCHSGGSVSFGPDGNLWLSSGDNTSSKESWGKSPMDERPGRSPFDAQKSSGNTNDLRGKIIRIKPLPDGTYSIPDGNLFPKDGSQGRPEIFAMGVRSPFRFHVDMKTGFLYWGEVGPDSGKDDEKGPQSYDEWNQARSAGNYGWPYFEANNIAFPVINFETEEPGSAKDPEKPTNLSPNNTGAKELPPARQSFIWYQYGDSEIWPMLGRGSRSAMSGPVYYSPTRPSKVAFPEYYERKLFIYEWARSWIKVVSFDEDWNLTKIEPFLPNEDFVKPIDMEFDQYGAMYILEYGSNYFANNVDAKLVKIEYSEGNRLPVPSIAANKTRGAVPLTVNFSAGGSFDYDKGDELTYRWTSSDGSNYEGKDAMITFNSEGKHEVTLRVTDSNGESASAYTTLLAGNEPPEIALEFSGNQSFYFDNETYNYKVSVSDKEDGSTDFQIAPSRVKVNFTYMDETYDLALLGEAFFSDPYVNIKGQFLIENSDCLSCHSVSQKSIGPDYLSVANRYNDSPGAVEMLAKKIIEGGSGIWGENIMAAHPQLSVDDAMEMVDYILSLGKKGDVISLPLKGDVLLNQHSADDQGVYVLGVRYTDSGNGKLPRIEASKMVMIKPPALEAESYDFYKDVQHQRPNGGNFAYLSNINNGSYIGYDDIDLKGITRMTLRVQPARGGIIKAVAGSPDGEVLGQVEVPAGEFRSGEWKTFDLSIAGSDTVGDLYFVFENGEQQSNLVNLDKIEFSK